MIKIKTFEDIVIEYYLKHYELYEVPEEFHTKKLCKKFIKHEPTNIKYIKNKSWKICKYAMKIESERLKKGMIYDEQIEPYVLVYFWNTLTTYEQFLEAIKYNGRSIRYVPKKYITKEICNESIKSIISNNDSIDIVMKIKNEFITNENIDDEININIAFELNIIKDDGLF